ncbi:MAG TPA: hypothetical protein VLW48_00875 [Candidatus Bathyarchaeia archaeon]|nr:hypothetical protein [Candidatus Bathyarchaeia archaeon]
MSRSLRILAACAVAAAAFAFVAPAQAFVLGAYHIMPTPAYKAKLLKEGVPPPAGPVNYYGGSVFTSSKVVSVMWGSGVNSTIVSTIPGFSAAIVNSTYVDQMSQYNTKGVHAINGHKSTKQIISRGTYLGQIVINPKNKNTTLQDSDVQAEIEHQIKKGVLPPRDLNTLYMVYFPQNVTIELDGLTSCVDFGAYHFATVDTTLSKKNIFYAVEPDCGGSIGNITFAASHEFAEATTDNVPTPGSFPDFPQAWNDANGFEIGDLCGTSGQLSDGTNHWTVTQYFLNSTMHCSTGNYTSP